MKKLKVVKEEAAGRTACAHAHLLQAELRGLGTLEKMLGQSTALLAPEAAENAGANAQGVRLSLDPPPRRVTFETTEIILRGAHKKALYKTKKKINSSFILLINFIHGFFGRRPGFFQSYQSFVPWAAGAKASFFRH